MIFLIEYDRENGCLVELQTFPDADRQLAEDSRIDLEVRLNRAGSSHEVVLLQAANVEALRATHGRYFGDIEEIVRTAYGTGTLAS